MLSEIDLYYCISLHCKIKKATLGKHWGKREIVYIDLFFLAKLVL